MKEFMKKPVTWGGYFKLCGVSLVLSLITSAITYWRLTREWDF